MNVLVVDEEVPYPLYTGKKLRTYHLVRCLQDEFNITYLCYGPPVDSVPGLPRVRFVTLPSPVLEQRGPRFYLSLLKNVLSPFPYIVDRHRSSSLNATVARLVKQTPADLVHCEWTPYAETVKQLTGTPTVLAAHNVEAQIWKRMYETEKSPVKRWYIGLQWRKLHRYEASVCGRFSRVATVSEPDAQLMRSWYGCTNTCVVPNGVDEEYFTPRTEQLQPYNMVFTASMDWRPNQDAMRYFIDEIYPLIRAGEPRASLTIVGRNPPQWLREMAQRAQGVTVTGTVDDVRPHVANASLYIVPLRIGGGSRLKILEALAMSKPVLSTTVGAEGLSVSDGTHVLLRDSPEVFARTALDVMGRPRDFAAMAQSGRDLVLRTYTWRAIASTLAAAWRQAAESA